jgi:biopolymer transport protein ExbB/TolQ
MNTVYMFFAFFKEGGIVMYFMLAIAVVVVAIAAERFIVISRAGGLNSRKLMEDVLAHVRRGDVAAARNCSRMSNAPAARVAEGILLAAGEDEAKLQRAADDAAILALAPLSRRLSHLNVLANVATLLGLLGTISGLITAFSAVGAADPSQRSAFMAAGISTALNATAFGLMIAIPTLIIQGFLAGKVERIAEQVDEMAIRLGQAMVQGPAVRGVGQVTPMRAALGPAAPARATAAPRGGVE